tara:strand:+ start:691 stop:3027 length:2337 start_codon:yes stop_codon:yes gene_type:complete
MTTLQNLIDEKFVCFTFSGISTRANAQGIEKKTPMGLPKHAEINKDNFKNYCNPSHKAAAIITGKMSNITVIDFDDKDCYESMVTKFPDLKKYRTIKTNKGYHIYCQYDPNIISTTDALATYPKVDIRNDGGIIFCSPTTYKLLDGSIAKYEDIGGDILPIPEIIMTDIKPDKFIVKSIITEPNIPLLLSKAEPIEKPIKKSTHTDDLTYIKNAIEKGYLNDKAMSDSYDDWRNVGFIFKHTSHSQECLDLFHQFSALNESKYDKTYTDVFWKSIKQPDKKPLTILTLKKWVSEKQANATICATDLDAAIFILNELKDVFKSCNGRLFYLLDNIWIHDENKINNHILMYVMNLNICVADAISGKVVPKSKNIGGAKKIVETLYAHVHVNNNDTKLYDKFHITTKAKLCFNDGVLDFKKRTFTLWSAIPANTIYTTNKINRDFGSYFNNANRKDIDDITAKIFETSYGKNKNRSLHFLSRAIAGHVEDKRWGTYLGNRNSGKGVEYELLKCGLEDYVKTFELGNILYCRKTAGAENIDCSKKLYWLMDLEFARLAVSQEIPDSKAQLVANGKMLKKISGGEDTIVARRNYDRHDTHFIIDASFYIKGNFDLQIDSNDCNETRVEFNSVVSFVDQSQIDIYRENGMEEDELKRYKIADSDIKQKCKTEAWANAIVYMLYENYQAKAITIIKEINSTDEETPYKAIKDKYIITANHNTDFILCQDLHDNLAYFCKAKLCLELQSLNVLKKKYKKNGHLKDKWCYSGIQLKLVEKDPEIIMD